MHKYFSKAVVAVDPRDGQRGEDDAYGYLSLSPEEKKIHHARDAEILADLVSKYLVDGPPNLSSKRGMDVTASDVAAVCGEGYDSPHQVKVKKLLHLKTPSNENMEHGHRYEPVALDKLRASSVDGSRVKRLYNLDYMQHAEHRWLGGTVDGVAELEDGRVFVVEVKCPLKRRIVRGVIPDVYQSQIQIYMYITGIHSCAFVQFKPKLTTRQKEVFDVTVARFDPDFVALRLPMLKRLHDDMVTWHYVHGQRMLAAVNVIKAVWMLRRIRAKGGCDGDAARVVVFLRAVFYFVDSMCRRRLALAEELSSRGFRRFMSIVRAPLAATAPEAGESSEGACESTTPSDDPDLAHIVRELASRGTEGLQRGPHLMRCHVRMCHEGRDKLYAAKTCAVRLPADDGATRTTAHDDDGRRVLGASTRGGRGGTSQAAAPRGSGSNRLVCHVKY
jgi:putative phage-type endonuclease